MTSSASPEALDETLLALRRVMMAMRGRWHAGLQAHGLTFPQWLLLKSVARRGRMTVRELADTCEVTSANVTGILDRLERERLVTRSRSAEDRRVVHVRLTEEGHDKVRAVLAEGPSLVGDMFEGWSAEELATLRGLLARVRVRPDEVLEF